MCNICILYILLFFFYVNIFLRKDLLNYISFSILFKSKNALERKLERKELKSKTETINCC